jgi:hypothetical protein
MGYDPLGNYTPDDDTAPAEEETLTPQEKLKIELQQLNAAQTSVAPPKVQLTPEQLAKVVKTEKITPTSPNEKPVENQDPPVPDDVAITMDPDTPQLEQPDYTVKDDAKIRMLSTESKPGRKFSPEVESAMDQVKHLYPNMTREQLGAFIQVESAGIPWANQGKNTQYKGLLQIGTRDTAKDASEWTKYGGGKDVYDAVANLTGGAKLMERNRARFIKEFGQEPTPGDLYLIHQQGFGFFKNGTMTNIVGNLPPDARKPENMTWEGFRNWWTNRINREVERRGTAPSMRVAEPNLPNGFLYPGAWADVGGPELTKGGLNDTPEAQAMISELMRKTPLAQQGGTARAATEAAIDAARDPNRRSQKVGRVPLSRERTQVPGQIPGSVSHTDTLPIPGITSDGTRALIDATNPTMLSTIMNYQADPANITPPPVVEVKQPIEPKSASFLDQLIGVVKALSTSNESNAMTSENIKALLNKSPETPWSEVIASGANDAKEGIKSFDRNLTAGLVGGMMSQPGQIGRSIGGWGATTAGQLSGYDPLTKWGIETQMAAEPAAKSWKAWGGADPNSAVASGAFKVGENIGPNAAKTLFNLGMSKVGEDYLGPAAKWAGTNYPIPNLNPISPAHAASVFGKPPLIVDTPGGPVAMNDADISQFVYGGAFAVGFGSSMPLIAKGVRVIRTAKPFGLDGVFDPRRPVTGAPGTEAASLPVDRLKASVLDPGKAVSDILERQVKFEKATRHGIDPLAANEVLQHWKVQTNSGAQALIGAALKEGEMNAPEYRFNVKVSLAKIAEYAKAVPNFNEYLRLKIIGEEINKNIASNRFLPPGSKQAKKEDFTHNTIGHVYDQNSVAQSITWLENQHPEMKQMFRHYQDNLIATRDFVTSHSKYAIEDGKALTAHAIQNPSMPIFSSAKKVDKLIEKYTGGADPLKVAEQNMIRAFETQMRFDAEQRYIKMASDYIGDKAFTPRSKDWVKDHGSGAKESGALMTRRHNGEVKYYTADPLIVSIFNSGHVPLSGLEQAFAQSKSLFQKTTTGFFAPWFAPTGMIRAMEQGWTTAPGGIRTAAGKRVMPSGPVATIMGVATRLGPQMARPTAKFFGETLANTAWGRTLTGGQADLIARSLEKWYMDSAYRKMQVSGGFNESSVMEGQEVAKSIVTARKLFGQNHAMNPVVNMMEKAIGTMKAFTYDPLHNKVYKPINSFLTAVQEAPAYEMARKTLKGSDETHRPTQNGKPLSDAQVSQAVFKNYTGDPSIRGFHRDKSGKMLRFDPGAGQSFNRPLNPIQRGAQNVLRATWGAQNKAVDLLGTAAHGSRSVTPWAGVLYQSPSATLAAMRDNPVRANLAFAASAVLPEVTAYLWNAHWSTVPVPVYDENGQPVLDAQGRHKHIKYDYVNHMMNGRNEHNLMNNVYFAHPYKKPNEGWEARHYQEVAFNRYMTRAFMHQYMGKNFDHMGDDLQKAMWGFLATAVVPPMPSAAGAFLGSKGMVSTGGFMGSLYKTRNNPYIDLGGGESPLELTFRAIIPSITDIFLQGQQAGMSAPDWWSVPGAVTKQVGKRIAGRTAILGEATGTANSGGGSTSQSDELWSNKKVIDDLTYRYRVWDEGQGGIKINKGSKSGRAFIADFMGELPPTAAKDLIANPGLQQAPPKNPLYGLLMKEIEKTFQKDEPKKGGIGFKAMWGLYGVYGQLSSRMRTVNEGNASAWVAKQLQDPETMQWLRERNVNPLDFRDVTQYYQSRRNKVTQQILQTVRATEQRLSQMPGVQKELKGKPFKINMLDPDKLGINPDAHGMTPDPDY